MIVYRVEHFETALGPYKTGGGNCEKTLGISGFASVGRPMWYDDGLKHGARDHERYGFVSTEHLKNWFPEEERKKLFKHGFLCRVYEVPKKHVRFGKRQIIFDSKHAKFVRNSRTIKK